MRMMCKIRCVFVEENCEPITKESVVLMKQTPVLSLFVCLFFCFLTALCQLHVNCFGRSVVYDWAVCRTYVYFMLPFYVFLRVTGWEVQPGGATNLSKTAFLLYEIGSLDIPNL